MRRKDREITDIRKAEEIVAFSRIMHLGLYDVDYPYVVPLHYGYRIENGRVILFIKCGAVCHQRGCIKKKAKFLVEIFREKGCITGETACGFGAGYESVMFCGTAKIVEDATEKASALRLLMKTQTDRDFDITEDMAAAVCVVRIDTQTFSAKARKE